MQRVVSINLNGNAYQVEENGYNGLFAFLDATESALTDDPDRAQKLADLERLIADKCQAYLGPHKTVITSAEVERLLIELEPGRAQSAAQPAAASASGASSGPSSSSSSTSSSASSSSSSSTASSAGDAQAPPSSSSWHAGHRRLFQIREGAMISGVCMGLSEYLHIDVTVIRILFVIFALASSGWGMLLYAVLMFVVPKVDTRAAASGDAAAGPYPPYHWPWDNGWPWDKHGWPWDPPKPGGQPSGQTQSQTPPAQSGPTTRQEWRDQRREWRREARAARMAHPGHMFGTMSMIVCLMIGFFWLSFWSRGNFFFGWPFFWGFPHWIGIIFFFMMLRFIFMPFRASRWHGYGPYAAYPHPHYAWVSMWNGLMWFGGMIFLVWAVYHYVPEVHDFFRNEIQTGAAYRYHV